MRECKNCGFRNLDERKTCLKCNYPLEHIKGNTPKIKFRFTFLDKLTAPLNVLLYKISQRFRTKLPENVPFRYPYLAGLLGALPGCSAFYNHQKIKGSILGIIYLFLTVIIILSFKESYSNYIIMTLLLFVFGCYADGFATAVMINGQLWEPRKTVAMFFFAMFMFGFILFCGAFLTKPFFLFVHMNQRTFEPVINKNDRLFVDKVTYNFLDPKRGDMVFYNPESFGFLYSPPGGSPEVVSVSESNSFGKISALPGETVEIKNDVIYVDGKPLPKEYYPFGPNYPENFKFGKIPDGHYLIVFSHFSYDSGFIPEGITIFLKGLRNILRGKLVIGIAQVITGQTEESIERSVGEQTLPWIKNSFEFKNYNRTCIVKKSKITGRVLLRYNPPETRQFFPPPNAYSIYSPK